MEFSGKFGGRAGLLCLSFCMFLTLSCATGAQDPRKNVNLSPFWQWRSAYECLQNTSTACGANELNMTGVIYVTGSSQVMDYCTKCAPWIRDVLTCIHSVKRDFWFINNATVQQINASIHNGCDQNKDIIVLAGSKSGTMRNFSGTYMALFSALVLAIFLFST